MSQIDNQISSWDTKNEMSVNCVDEMSVNCVVKMLEDRRPSRILDPVSFIDEVARAWFGVMTRSRCRNEGDPPIWFRTSYTWGPNEWPMTWNDSIRASVGDCGLLAALALEAWTVLGSVAASVQIVVMYNESATRHWQARWSSHKQATDWIFSPYVYHEGVAVLQAPFEDSKARIWDPTSGCWMNERTFSGYGSVHAVRISRESKFPSAVSWSGRRIPVGNWTICNG